MKEFANHYRSAVFEVPLFDDYGWQAALGVTEDEFQRFRAAWLGWAETCLGMADALKRRVPRNDPERERLGKEYLEWVVPYLTRDFVEGVAMAVSGLAAEPFDSLMAIFAHEPGGRAFGDGFLPPLQRLGNGLLFAPDAVRSMMLSRNVAYALNRTEPVRFAELLSHRLEPQLLTQASAILSRLPQVDIRLNVPWIGGEIDLLAFDARTGTALQVQAKAPVPPQGARMTAAIEGRAREGLRQLRALAERPRADVDRIVSRAFDRPVEGVVVHDVLLARTCFGGYDIWSALGSVVPMNLHLLEATVQRMEEEGLGLDRLATTGAKVLDHLVADAVIGWEDSDVDFALTSLSVPLLRLREEPIERARRQFFPAL